MRSHSARLAAVAFAASVTAFLACPETASAYERQWHAGGSLGYALIADEETFHGLGGGLHLTYGLSDVFNAMLQVDFTTYPGNELIIGSAAVGVGYVVDILEWVPYIGLMAGGYQLSSFADACDVPDCSSTRFGVSVPFGLDYLFTRSFAMGVQGRYHLLLSPDGAASHLTAFARAEYIWGW